MTDFIKLSISDHLGNHKKPQSDVQLGYYLAGLIEGDGYFGYKKLEIAYHEKDISAAYSLREHLGFGQIYKYSQNRKAVRFVISNKKGLKRVLDLVNGKFVSAIKVNQLVNKGYESWLGYKILDATLNIDLNNHWLAGFLDADGSIGIFIVNSKSHKHKKSVRLEIKFTQKHKLVLSLIGSIFEVKSIYKDKNNIHRLTLRGINRVIKIINYLDNYCLQTMKYTQYTIFRRCVRYIQNKHHLQSNVLEQIAGLKRTLQNVYN
uniref:Homing endonuclease LAGLIDADG domain-containing protein n=1 Tax=Ulva sp. TM708 TaxID=2496873 RepID=A0A7R6NFE1_9CHLO|nr:hypothetical protein JXX85_mgp03 [Ulva sp. TM708]AZP40117.1 hypothetical protein [Ulva sp. TM708]